MPGMDLPTKKLVLPVLLLAAFGGLFSSRWQAKPTIITAKLEVSQQHPTKATYLSFMTSLDAAVKSTTTDSVLDRPLLRKQKLKKPPAYWVNVQLTDADNKVFLTLAFRNDNLYLSGFQNRHGKWFAFEGQEETLPDSTALSYKGDYPDIFPGKGWTGLASVEVNRVRALANAELLADYTSGSDDKALKPALGFFILTVAEAERFPTLRAALADVMEKATPQKMSKNLVQLAVNWKRLSCALRAWVKHGKTTDAWNGNTEATDLKKIGIDTPKEALDRIQPMLRSKDCTMTPKTTSASVHAE